MRNHKGLFQKGHRFTQGEKNGRWRGDDVKSNALHMWVISLMGKPYECVYCGVNRLETRMEWASISHNAHRDLNDFISLCVKCHRLYDKNPIATYGYYLTHPYAHTESRLKT